MAAPCCATSSILTRHTVAAPGGDANKSKDPGVAPGGNGAERPGSNTAERPGSNTAERPGSNTAERPGSNTAERPGSNAARRVNNSGVPGHNSAARPGHNSAAGQPGARQADNDDEDEDNTISLAAMEALLTPVVLAKFDEISRTYKKIRRLQEIRVNAAIKKATFSRPRKSATTS